MAVVMPELLCWRLWGVSRSLFRGVPALQNDTGERGNRHHHHGDTCDDHPRFSSESRHSTSGRGWIRHGWMVPVHPRVSDAAGQNLSSWQHLQRSPPLITSRGRGRRERSGRIGSGQVSTSLILLSHPHERAREQWFEPHGSVRLDVVDRLGLGGFNGVCVCVCGSASTSTYSMEQNKIKGGWYGRP